jgi:hypothetical protein
MRNPMWFVETNLERVMCGRRAVEHELTRQVRAIDRELSDMGFDETFRAEIRDYIIRRAAVLVIELGLLSLASRVYAARARARVYPLPVPQPAS